MLNAKEDSTINSPPTHNYEISSLYPLKREPHTASPQVLNPRGPHTAFHPSGPHTALSHSFHK